MEMDQMTQFILVANGITNENFEKAMEVKIRAAAKITFVPQGASQHGATTQSMSSAKPASNAPAEVLNSVRFEWTHDGEELGAEFGPRSGRVS
jgi:hypothetical protein